MIRQLSHEYPVSLLCEVLDVARSTVYYAPQVKPEDASLLEAIERILIRWPRYGYRRVTAQLKREGCEVGETRVRRLLKKLDHSASVGRVRVRTTDSQHAGRRFPNLIKELKITDPNQVWVADITYIRLGRQFIYLAVILDAFTRGSAGLASWTQSGSQGSHRKGAGDGPGPPSGSRHPSLGPGKTVCGGHLSQTAPGHNPGQHGGDRSANGKRHCRALYPHLEGGACRLL